MATVLPFNRSIIEAYLHAQNLRFMRDEQDDFQIKFGYDDDWGCELTVWICIEGSDDSILSMRTYSNRAIDKSEWGQAIMACNQWNQERRWPKAFLYIDKDDPQSSSVMVEMQLDLSSGIHAALFHDLAQMAISGSFQFWKWIKSEGKL